MKRSRWVQRHPRISLFAVGVAVLIILAGVLGSPPKKSGQQSTTTAAIKRPPNESNARHYIATLSKDMNTVQASVQSVQGGLQILKGDTNQSDTSAVDQFAVLAQQAHDFIDKVRSDFATGSGDNGKLGDAETELFAAANDLKNAMGTVVAYTGNPNPATLARFTSQYGPAVQEWNDGVRTIWRIARRKRPPTL